MQYCHYSFMRRSSIHLLSKFELKIPPIPLLIKAQLCCYPQQGALLAVSQVVQIQNQKSTLIVYFLLYIVISDTLLRLQNFSFSLEMHQKPSKAQLSVIISRPFLYTKSVHYFPLKNLKRKFYVLVFEHQFRHELEGLETKFFWLPLTQQISSISSTLLIDLSDQKPRYQHFCDRFLWRKLLDTFSIVKLTKQYGIASICTTHLSSNFYRF